MRIGLVLQFLSFWFAAPEILGEARLRKLEGRTANILSFFPKNTYFTGLFIGALLVVYIRFFGGGSTRSIMAGAFAMTWFLVVFVIIVDAKSDEIGIILVLATILTLADMLAITLFAVGLLQEEHNVHLSSVVYEVYRAVRPTFLIAILAFGVTKIPPKIIKALADNEHTRQRSLVIGTVLFVAGFLFQFMSTFSGSPAPPQ